MVGWAVKVVAAFLTSGFEERIGVDFKGLGASGWPVKGIGAVPQFFALLLPKIFDLCGRYGIPAHNFLQLRPIVSLQNSSYFGRVHLDLLSFNFLESHFFLFVRVAHFIEIVHKMWPKKWVRETAPGNLWGPFLRPF